MGRTHLRRILLVIIVAAVLGMLIGVARVALAAGDLTVEIVGNPQRVAYGQVVKIRAVGTAADAMTIDTNPNLVPFSPPATGCTNAPNGAGGTSTTCAASGPYDMIFDYKVVDGDGSTVIIAAVAEPNNGAGVTVPIDHTVYLPSTQRGP